MHTIVWEIAGGRVTYSTTSLAAKSKGWVRGFKQSLSSVGDVSPR